MDLRAQFTQVQPFRQLERRFVRETLQKNPLASGHLEVLRYALSFARLTSLKAHGREHDVFEQVAPFRHWVLEQLSYFADPDEASPIDWRGVEQLVPEIQSRVSNVRRHLLEHHANDFSVDRFEREVTRKELVLVLGGGGGSGYAHMGAFAVIAELGLTPRMVVGASMGAMLGVFRAHELAYDPMATALALPRPSEFGSVFSPYRGFSKYGFPGTMELKGRSIGKQIFENLVGRDIPRITELPIAYRAVATGLRTGFGLALEDVERDIARASGRRTTIRRGQRLRLFFSVVKAMMENPRFLKQIVFGSDEGLEDFNAIDAMGFSCAVPGIIHYDLFAPDDPSARALRGVMDAHNLIRITDGGVVNNVPCRAAWDCVQRGEIGTRNTFILGFDAFAPVINRNAMFVPVQQWVRRNVRLNKPYSDHLITYKQPPSPVQLLASFDSLQDVISRTRTQLRAERPLIEAMMRPIPRFAILENRVIA